MKDIREYILTAPGTAGGILLTPAKKIRVTTERNTLNQATIWEILDAELSKESQVINITTNNSELPLTSYSLWMYTNHKATTHRFCASFWGNNCCNLKWWRLVLWCMPQVPREDDHSGCKGWHWQDHFHPFQQPDLHASF